MILLVYQLSKLQMLEFYYDFLDKYFSRQESEFCFMDTDLFYLAISGDSLDEIGRAEIREEYKTDNKIGLQQTNFARKLLAYSSLNLLVQEVCGSLPNVTLFKMKFEKTNLAVKMFQRGKMICIFSSIKVS